MSTATSSSRVSYASTGVADGLREKRREYEAASAIKEDTKMIAARLKALGQQGELLADGGVGSFKNGAEQGVLLTRSDTFIVKPYLAYSEIGLSSWLPWPNSQVRRFLSLVSLLMACHRITSCK